MADLSALQSELSALKESLRIKQQSIANINPNYQMNQAYLAKLKVEVASLNTQIAAKNAEIAAATAPTPAKATPKTDYGQAVRPPPYDETGALNLGYGINELGEPYWTGDPAYVYSPPKSLAEVPAEDPAVPVRGTPWDEEGNLNNGWSLDENGEAVWVGAGYNDATGQTAPSISPDDDPELAQRQAYARQDQEEYDRALAQYQKEDQDAVNNSYNAPAGTNKTPSATTYTAAPDWRLRISLSPKSTYLYNDSEPGILAPLKATKGVIFPYTPTVNVAYNATYDSQTITHSNFKSHNYQGSSVDQITVTGDFTAQDIQEANYMLAVIHFFRSATKMFYGQDTNPVRGTPPPLLYMSGFGQYQFDNHPMVLTGFTYNLPADVDYINAYPNRVEVGVNGAALSPYQPQSVGGSAGPIKSFINDALSRLTGSGLQKGGKSTGPVFSKPPTMTNEVTRVPTKINISLTFLPIVTRNAISNEFSLKDYASGKLLRGSQNPKAGGGIW
jgi:hypothetical protein